VKPVIEHAPIWRTRSVRYRKNEVRDAGSIRREVAIVRLKSGAACSGELEES
jgi:hypothetical protein